MKINVSGTEIAFSYRTGDTSKRHFVFIHGTASNNSSGKNMEDFFYSRGHSVLSYDLPGHGSSAPYHSNLSMNILAAINAEILNLFNIRQPIIAGHSLGGMILLQYAVENPNEISSLILADTTAVDPVKLGAVTQEQCVQTFELSRGMYKGQSKSDFSQSDLNDEGIISAGFKSTDPASLEGLIRATFDFDVRDRIGILHHPTLILRGSTERNIMTEAMSKGIQERISGSYLVPVEGGHYWLIQKPEVVKRILDSHYGFLTKQ